MSEEEPVRNSSPWPLILIIGLIFLPGGILAFMLWGMLRWGRQRPSVVGLAALIVSAISVLVIGIYASGIASGAQELSESFDGNRLGELALNIVPIWISVSLILGSLAGWGFAIYSARQMKKNPYLTKLEGSWRHNFKYRRTPREYLSRKRNIRALKNGLLVEDSKAPMGMDEKTDEVVSRFDSEARKHTFMTGASGSGKALHAATLIPTMNGFKRVGRIRIGDVLINPQGLPTKVLGVYQPMTKDHYKLVFSNGEEIKACGDHLWTVKEAGGDLQSQTVSTRKIAENPSNWYITPLRNPIQTAERVQVNSKLLGAWLASGAPDGGVILKRDALSRELMENYGSFVQDLRDKKWIDSEGKVNALDYDALMTSVSSRELLLQGAVSIAGSYTFNGQTKLTLPDREIAEFFRTAVFSLGVQASQLEESAGAFSFRFINKSASRTHNQFAVSLGDISRKGAPTRGLIKIVSVTPIEDNPEHYFCFEVDSPDHMFLVGRSFTPTHNTITMQSLIHADIEVGKTVVVIDFKRSPKFASKLAAWSEEYGREFYHFVNGNPENYDIPRSKGQCTYDPLGSGTTTSKADMVIGMREYDTSAAVYEAAMQQLLQVLFAMMENADRKVASSIDWNHGGIFQLASAVGGNGLGELAAANTVEKAPGSTPYTYNQPGAGGITGAKEIFVNSPTAKEAIELVEALRSKGPLTQARDELQGQIRTIIASEYGRWMRTGGNHREIDLFDLTSKEGNVILFSLNSDSEPKFAQFVGSMIFSDLTNISALRRNAGSDNQVNIYVDEFQAVPPSAVTSLLEKSRESKMALTIAQQSFDQVVASAEKAGEAYLNSILDTCSNFIAHAGATEKSATRLAEILGKNFVTVYSKTNESDSSFLSVNWSKNQSSKVAAREEERWVFPPSEFMGLSSPDQSNGFKSSAVWVTKTSADPAYSSTGGATARAVWMIPPDDVLVEYYEGGAAKPKPRPKALLVEEEAQVEVAPQRQQPIQPSQVSQEELMREREAKIAKAREIANYEEDFEETDGEDEEWDFEEIPDEEIDGEEEENLPMPEVKPREATREEYSLDDLFSGGNSAPTPGAKPVEKRPAAPAPQEEALPGLPAIDSRPAAPKPAQRPGGLPTRPGAGLPIRRPTTPDEDTPLPKI